MPRVFLNGPYDAKGDHPPVVAIVGQQPTTALGAECRQEIDLSALFENVAAQHAEVVLAPEQAGIVLDRGVLDRAGHQVPVRGGAPA